MIKRIQSPDDLLPLFRLDHGEDADLPYSFEEWLQWLVAMCTDERLAIFADFNEEGRIVSYIVLGENISPPLTNSTIIIYAWTRKRVLDQVELFQAVDEWSISRGASVCNGKTNIPEEICNHYGFYTTHRFIEKRLGE